MIAYPYDGRDLFAAPESYEFASCASEDFFAAWRASRDAALERLRRAAGATPSPCRAEAIPAAHSLRALLEESRRALTLMVADIRKAKPTIDALVQKFEIYRRLFSAYDGELRKAKDATPAMPADYVTFAETLAAWADKTDAPKYLSTLLKTVDALCSLPIDALSGDAAARLAAVIGEERRLVDRWAGRCDQ